MTTIATIHIPPAALEAGAEAFLECDRSPACSFEDALRAAFVAMVEAWDGMQHDTEHEKRTSYLILPLPQETSDE